jgi:hypothetical protein
LAGSKGSKYNLLHPLSALIDSTVKDLRIACTWLANKHLDIAGTIKIAKAWLRKPINTIPMSREAKSRLTEESKNDCHAVEVEEMKQKIQFAVHQLRLALEDSAWKELNGPTTSIPFDASTLDLAVTKAWSDSLKRSPHLLDAVSLCSLRDFNFHGTKADILIRHGDEVIKQKISGYAAELRIQHIEAKRRATVGKQTSLGRGDAAFVASEIEALRKARNVGIRKKEAGHEDEEYQGPPTSQAIDTLDQPRPLPDELYTYSHSSKVNWLLKTLIEADTTDKFVVFGSQEELLHLGDILALADIDA